MTTPTVDTITTAYRSRQRAIGADTIRRMLALWPALRVDDLSGSFVPWALAVGQLIGEQRDKSAVLAVGYLRAAKLTSSSNRGDPVIVAPAPLAPERLATSLHITSVIAIKQGIAAGRTPDGAAQIALVRSTGTATRFVGDAGRDTIIGSVLADETALGWERVTSPGACAFCRLLSGEPGTVEFRGRAYPTRGAVYKSDTATFRAHDHCGCTARPVYS